MRAGRALFGDATARWRPVLAVGAASVAHVARVACIACVLAPLSSAFADDTPSPCAALRRIVAAAPDFAALSPEDGRTAAAPYGDARCAARAGRYECSWTQAGADALQGVAADIASCLPEATHDQNSPTRQHFYLGAPARRTEVTAIAAGAGGLKLVVTGNR